MNHELLPAMEEANVTMKNPWTVKVTIKEKRVAGYIVSGDECIYFDKDGIVLAKTKELWDGIPCIEGLEVKKVQLYKALPVSKALFPDRIRKQGSFWCADRDRSDGTYDDSGYFKYCSCDEHNSEYGDYTSFYQLWWYIGDVSFN